MWLQQRNDDGQLVVTPIWLTVIDYSHFVVWAAAAEWGRSRREAHGRKIRESCWNCLLQQLI